MERLQLGQDWFLVFSGQHHVDPIIFVAVNQAAILFFFASLYWLFKNMTKKKSIIIPTLLIGFFYFNLIIIAQHLPLWVYLSIDVMISYGICSTIGKIKDKLKTKN